MLYKPFRPPLLKNRNTLNAAPPPEADQPAFKKRKISLDADEDAGHYTETKNFSLPSSLKSAVVRKPLIVIKEPSVPVSKSVDLTTEPENASYYAVLWYV